jgi:hypothetical protein
LYTLCNYDRYVYRLVVKKNKRETSESIYFNGNNTSINACCTLKKIEIKIKTVIMLLNNDGLVGIKLVLS